MEIKRKPVPAPPPPVEYGVRQPLTPNPPPYSPYLAYSPYSSASPHSPHFPPPPPRFTPSPSPSPTCSLQPPHSLPRYRSQPNLRVTTPLSPQPTNPPPLPRAETTVPTDSEKSSFYADARHFLGGLIHHPSESTKHYSILRHSHGIVFYRGPTTSVTVSIFADAPLPADRSLWLQCKGWSGKTGMRAKALFRMHDDWVNATPTVAVRADQVDPNKERAWQRDIAKFYKKASKRVQTHRLRETVVARIPPDAEDGYFQLILCHGEKKVLCRSPVFRILSASMDPSSLRGASLTTMPLELGALVAGTYAQVAASRVVAPVAAVAETVTARYRPGWLGETAIQTAYEALKPDHGVAPDPAVPPSIENGPQPPYPLDFTARPSQSHDPCRIPVKVPADIQDKLRGYFFGWARTSPDTWQMIILSVRLWDGSQQAGPVSLSQTTRKVSVLRLLHEPIPNPPSTLPVRILGFLHPDIPPPSPRTENDLAAARQAAAEAAALAEQYDTEYVQALLDHPLWGPEVADRRGWFDRTKDGAGNVLARGQKMIERVGVRTGVERESMGGYYIVRG
ncbi:uncharacterized protein BDW70DRAFT_171334 [Aspergillus foveolatus]|uniref:uncharacterized protein n=1 Tax=Aspergillus foveolatus TaxID=210207 RepID=UPI003CCD9C2E